MKHKKLCKAMAQWLGLGVVGIQAVHAGGVVTVDSIEDQPQAGLTTLREAIETVNGVPGAFIDFDATLFSTPQTITLQNSDLKITAATTIIGPGADLLTIDGSDQTRILTIDSGQDEDIEVAISGMTFTRGNGASETDNSRGGCIYTFDNLTLTESVVTECNGSNGGGIWSRSSALNIQNSILSNNSVNNKGGALYRKSGSADISNTTIVSNSARKGGGIYLTQAGLILSNSTLSNNQGNQGGGIRLESGSPRMVIRNSTIFNNIGIGLDVRNTKMSNTIITGNTDGDCVFLITGSDNQNNLDTDGSCNVEAINHTTVADPRLGPLFDNGGFAPTHIPLNGSPAIDNGDDLLCLLLDQRGEDRPQDGDGNGTANCDIGAVEGVLNDVVFINGFE
ncbi:choice-of-anchor Q domain-containing protein [Marinicella sp. W31]|uniref:choice-of-anchor Q domain-containing protein n=1 Tax=Marinicella sp. W31 TaxID=3023713 RepID=UPI003756CC00